MKEKLRIRPYFDLVSDQSKEEVLDTLKKKLTANPSVSTKYAFNMVYVRPKADVHFWSPHLAIAIDSEDEATQIRGLYGPAPSVWTMFMFFYVILALLIMILLIIGGANLSLGEPSSLLYLALVGCIMVGTLYAISYLGQKKGHQQIEIVHQAVEEALGLKIDFV